MDSNADLLYGVPAIAEYVGLTDKQVYHLHYKNDLPTFKIGGKICSLKSRVDGWFQSQIDR